VECKIINIFASKQKIISKPHTELDLLKIFFPIELFNSFELVNSEVTNNEVHIYFDEQNKAPENYESSQLIGNGFYPTQHIHDFPIRDKKAILHVRRRWIDAKTHKDVSNNWTSLTANGTHMSESFADFLKDMFRYTSDFD